ncbi:MAG TPA: hypothetical protein PK400_01710 [Phycisphaerales bacterium]|nr:hypothetical protein [Phycisphaerales bacterium]HRQ76480.1 hypothetical protein [Phycisphaerales bacterium]
MTTFIQSLIFTRWAAGLFAACALAASANQVHAGTVTWTGGGGDSLWSNPANWDSNPNLPGPTDDVVIVTGGEVNFDGPAGTQVASINVTGSFRISQATGTMTVAGDVIVSQTFTMSAGSLTLGGTLSVHGAMSWTGGTIFAGNDVIIQPGVNATISGTSGVRIGGVLRNYGTITQTGNTLTLGMPAGDPGIVENLSGGVWNWTGGFLVLGPNPTTHAFVNEGLVVRSSTGSTGVGVPFHNEGTVQITGGTLNLTAGGSNAGFIEMTNPASTLRLGGTTDVFVHAPKSSIVAVGTIELQATQEIGNQLMTSGPIVLNGSGSTTVTFTTDRTFSNTVNLPTGAKTVVFLGDAVMNDTFTFAGGTIVVHGDLDINAHWNWSGQSLRVHGMATIDENATVTLTAASSKAFIGVMENYGVVTNNSGAGGVMTLGNTTLPGIFINKPGGEFIQQQGGISGFIGVDNYFINEGVYRKIGAQLSQVSHTGFINEGDMLLEGGTVQINQREFENEGNVVITGAALNIHGGGLNAGSINADAASTLTFAGSSATTFIHETGSTIVSNGQLNINNPPGQMFDDQLTVGGNVTIGTGVTFLQNMHIPGNLIVSHATSEGDVHFAGDLVLDGTFTKTSGTGILRVDGDFDHNGNGAIGGGTISVGGVMTVAKGQTLSRTGSTAVTFAGTMHVEGVFNNAQTLNIGTLLGITGLPGTMVVQPGGELRQSGVGGFAVPSGVDAALNHIVNYGTFRRTNENTSAGTYNVPFTNHALFKLEAGVQRFGRVLTQAGGVMEIPAGTGLHVDFAGLASLQVTGGIVEGEGAIEGPVNNTGGVISPGFSPGILSVIGSSGNYNQSSNGVLFIEIDGETPGTEHDRLAVSGTASLGGRLMLDFHPELDLEVNDEFEIVTATTVTGKFQTVTPCDGIRIVYTSNRAKVEVTGQNRAGDFNCDGVVDVLDLLFLLSSWGPCPKGSDCLADLNESNVVDVQDLLILLSNWG